MAGSIAKDTIVVEGKTYSARELAKIHPGGPLFIKAFSGVDASKPFLFYHRKIFPHIKAKKALVSDGPDLNNPPGWNKDYLELCASVEKILPRKDSFAPWYYYIKVAIILFTALYTEYYMHTRFYYHPLLCSFLGYVYAVIGLNIQHDANHGAISSKPWVNRILGMSQNWIGGSALSWIHQHVVQHHNFTNDVEKDPDLDGGKLLRLNHKTPLMKFHVIQHIYFFILLAFYGFSVVVHSLINVINGCHFTPMSDLVKPHRIFEVCTSIFFILRWIVYPLYSVPSIYTVASLFLMFVVAGYYLSLFFAISHNFDGVHFVDESSNVNSFLYNQVVTSSNVGGPILCFLNGGLNYQIEHHLFPRISHCHYPKIAPIVKKFCEDRNIPYVHFPTVLDNINSAITHLFFMGSKINPISKTDVNFLAEKLHSS